MKNTDKMKEKALWVGIALCVMIAIIGIAWDVHTTWGFDERTGQFDTVQHEAHCLDHMYGRSDDW